MSFSPIKAGTAGPPRSRHTPPCPEPKQSTLDERFIDLNSDGRVLVSPPALNDPNKFESAASESPQSITSSDNGHMLQHNFEAFTVNSRRARWSVSQESSSEPAHNLLDGLHIKTDVPLPPRRSGSSYSIGSDSRLHQSASASSLPRRIPSVRAALHSSAGSLSPGAVLTSPQITAMLNITPLPSPTLMGHDPWRIVARTRSRASSTTSRSDVPSFTYAAPPSLSPKSPSRRKAYHGLRPASEHSATGQRQSHNLDGSHDPRNRSTSEYVPEALSVQKPRYTAVSGTGPSAESTSAHSNMHREEYLGATRGMVTPVTKPPSPSSTVGSYGSNAGNEGPPSKRTRFDVFHAQSISSGQLRRYGKVKKLGQGTFSTVYLAVRQVENERDTVDYAQDSTNIAGIKIRSKRLVAVKVIEHGSAGVADAERVEVSLQREVEIMRAVKHPSLVHLRAFGSSDEGQALLVINYCPGGDLFEVASKHLDVLTASLIRRIFSELVSAVMYLHNNFIVHRDIKLENVLLNIPVQVHSDVQDWQKLDRAVVTLTDLGLSRRIPEPPESPLLETRCGSEDYAAPEILMGQPYDGRQTDAWALGVLLYALMEGRLPFDALPGARGDPAILRSRTPHRIARCEWAWCKFGDEDGDWDSEKGKEVEGASACVDGLLKRVSRRKALVDIEKFPWVSGGIQTEGGLRWVEEENL